MSTAALLSNPAPPAVRTCVACRWSRNKSGLPYVAEDLIFCGLPNVQSDDGQPVACARQRTAPSSAVMNLCGVSAIFWEPR